MKKADLEKRLARLAKENQVEWRYIGGTKHDKFRFGETILVIPRHREIAEPVAAKLLRQARQQVEEKGD